MTQRDIFFFNWSFQGLFPAPEAGRLWGMHDCAVCCSHAEQCPEAVPQLGAESHAAEAPGLRRLQRGDGPVPPVPAPDPRWALSPALQLGHKSLGPQELSLHPWQCPGGLEQPGVGEGVPDSGSGWALMSFRAINSVRKQSRLFSNKFFHFLKFWTKFMNLWTPTDKWSQQGETGALVSRALVWKWDYFITIVQPLLTCCCSP